MGSSRTLEVELVGPDGRARRRVQAGGRLDRTLRAVGWREAGDPEAIVERAERAVRSAAAHLGKSETAAAAREALGTLSLEEWVRDWGAVLCAALDEAELARGLVVASATAMADSNLAALEALSSIGDACLAWMGRTGWASGKPVQAPTVERQRASEDLVRLVMESVDAYRRRHDAAMEAAGGFRAASTSIRAAAQAAASGDPAARARASEALAELGRELAAALPDPQKGQILAQVGRVRAAFLGGSNLPEPPSGSGGGDAN